MIVWERWCLLLFHFEVFWMIVHQGGSKGWIPMEWVLKRIFLLLAERLVAELTFTKGCENSTELLFACCSLGNVSGVNLARAMECDRVEACVLEFFQVFKCVFFFLFVVFCYL